MLLLEYQTSLSGSRLEGVGRHDLAIDREFPRQDRPSKISHQSPNEWQDLYSMLSDSVGISIYQLGVHAYVKATFTST